MLDSYFLYLLVEYRRPENLNPPLSLKPGMLKKIIRVLRKRFMARQVITIKNFMEEKLRVENYLVSKN